MGDYQDVQNATLNAVGETWTRILGWHSESRARGVQVIDVVRGESGDVENGEGDVAAMDCGELPRD